MAGKEKTSNVEVVAVNEIYNLAQAEKNIEIAALKDKQTRIAQCHEVIGQYKAVKMVSKFADVSSLVWLNDVKTSKLYRDLPSIGTWEDFCNYIGLSRQKVDEDLMNLAYFGEEFLTTVSSLRVGYRELRKLRQLSADGTITIDAESVQINGETIPLDTNHKEDLQAAIEQIIDEQANVKLELAAQKKAYDRVQEDTRKSMVKLEKELGKFTSAAAAKGLSGDEDAFCQRIEKHRIMAQGALIALEPKELTGEFAELSTRMKTKAIATVYELRMQVLALYDTLVTEIGDGIMNPELVEDFDKWEQANGFKG